VASSAGSRVLADARSAFLGAEPFDRDAVREPILASWTRSRARSVPLVAGEVPYLSDLDDDTPLTRAAARVLPGLDDALGAEPVSLVLCDGAGTVLRRRTGDRRLERHLDRVFLARGFSYAERHVGTNGIGTSLECGAPVRVFGHEHFAENLEHLACAAAPVRHPVGGKVAGVVNLTCREPDAGVLLLTTATSIAAQLGAALRDEAGRRERALLEQFLDVCRRGPHPVLAVGSDAVMLNRLARQCLDRAQQQVLLDRARDALAAGRTDVVVDLPDGRLAEVRCTAVSGGGRHADAVLQVRLTARALPASRIARAVAPAPESAAMAACRREVQRHAGSGTWLLLQGEPGTGRTTLAAREDPHARVLDAVGAGPRWVEAVADALAVPGRALVLRHVDRLDAGGLHALTALLHEAPSAARSWVVGTVAPLPAAPSRDLAELVACFPAAVTVPALRHRLEDLPRLVAAIAVEVAPGRTLRWTPDALEVLARLPWAGNLAELRVVVERAGAVHRDGRVGAQDLPAELLAAARRRLTPLELLERDALLSALAQAHGSREQAAEALGASRATVYRKVRRYGLAGSLG